MMKRCLAVVLVAALLLTPSLALAQASKAGVVTTLEGTVTARRVAIANPVPLKFKSDVLLQDQVATGDKSLARMLLGGRAVVTVRERSLLTITEVPATQSSTIDLESGKFSLAVAREKMRPGEEILIRTPNAVAGVRGTVVITDVTRQGAQAGGAAPAVVTRFYVLRGTITVQQLDPVTKRPIGPLLTVGTLQAYTGAGSAPPRVAPISPEEVAQVVAGLTPSTIGSTSDREAGKAQVKAQAVQTAAALLTELTGDAQFGIAAPSLTTGIFEPIGVQTPVVSIQNPGVINGTSTNSLEECIVAAGIDSLLIDTLFSFDGDFTSTSLSALFQFINQSFSSRFSFLTVTKNGKVILAGPLASFTNSTIFAGGSLLDISGSLTSTGSSALLALDPTQITAAKSVVALNGGSLTLAGPLLTDTNGTIITAGSFLDMSNGATLTDTSTNALVQLTGTAVAEVSWLTMSNATMTLAGPLVIATGTKDPDPATVTAALARVGIDAATLVDGPFIAIQNNSSLTSTGTSPLIQFDSTKIDNNENIIRVATGSSVSLAGSLLSATSTDFRSGDPTANTFSFLFIGDGSQVRSTSSQPFLSFADSSVDAAGDLVSIRRSASSTPTRLTLAGPLFSATNSTFNTTSLGFGASFSTSATACCSGFFIGQGAQLSSTTSSALIQLTSSTFTSNDSQSGGNFFRVADTFTGAPASELVSPSSVTLAGPLLSATNSTITALFDLVQVQRSSLTSTTTSSLVSLSGGTVTLGGTNAINGSSASGAVLDVFGSSSSGAVGSAASVDLAGPLLSMTGGATLTLTNGLGIASVFNGAAAKSTTSSPFISITGSTVNQTNPSGFNNSLALIGGLGGPSGTTQATLTLAGPLLSVSNSTLNLQAGLVGVGNNSGALGTGRLIANDPTQPFVSLSGGTASIANVSNGSLFVLRGINTAVDTDANITILGSFTVGTDQPLQRSGSGAFLSLSNGASLSTQQGLFLDTALLSASAPLLDISGGSTMTTASDAINLNQRAKLTSLTQPLIKLNGSTLTINGNAVRLNNSALVTGDLLSIANGGKLNINGSNNAALFLNGASAVNITGFVVNFTGTGNQLNIANTLCPATCFTTTSGINVSLQGGATSAQISGGTGTAINNPVGNTVPSVNAAVVILNGTASQVRLP